MLLCHFQKFMFDPRHKITAIFPLQPFQKLYITSAFFFLSEYIHPGFVLAIDVRSIDGFIKVKIGLSLPIALLFQ